MLIRCLRISSETHYFSPKWNFSWKAIKIEGIKIFTRLIRLHASSGLIHHKQENNKRHLNREFLPEVFSTHHKTLEDDKEEIGISRAYKLALTHILCIQGGRKLEGYEGLHKQVLWASGNGLGPSSPLSLFGCSSALLPGKTGACFARGCSDQQLQAPSGPDTKGIPMLGMTYHLAPEALKIPSLRRQGWKNDFYHFISKNGDFLWRKLKSSYCNNYLSHHSVYICWPLFTVPPL